jgi:hypothetical protein
MFFGLPKPSRSRHAELVSASIAQPGPMAYAEKWTLKQVQGDELL